MKLEEEEEIYSLVRTTTYNIFPDENQRKEVNFHFPVSPRDKLSYITDIKFIGTVESQNNNFWKKFSFCSIYMNFFKNQQIHQFICQTNEEKNLEPNSWFKQVFGLMTLPEQGRITPYSGGVINPKTYLNHELGSKFFFS